jgi:excinuclease ABC subunit B
MYADTITPSMAAAIDETNRRRQIQARYNEEHGVVPRTVDKVVRETIRSYDAVAEVVAQYDEKTAEKIKSGDTPMRIEDLPILISSLEKEMKDLAQAMEFEKADKVRDEIQSLRALMGTSDGRLGAGKRKLKRTTVGKY